MYQTDEKACCYIKGGRIIYGAALTLFIFGFGSFFSQVNSPRQICAAPIIQFALKSCK